ncbi:MAG: delta-60 repeat domain-containing protein, partial [Ignavibacteriaceae bacterium]
MKTFLKFISLNYFFSCTLLCFILLTGFLFPQAGTLDNSFGNDGIVTTAIGSSLSRIKDIAIQSDGKIVAAGRSDNGALSDCALARYNSDGSLDNTFGSGGITTFGEAIINAIVILPDGKIVAAGYTGDYLDKLLVLIRFNS